MEDFEQVAEEEQWLEVRQKKTTPNKKPSSSKPDSGRREKRGESSKRINSATDSRRDGKKREDAKKSGSEKSAAGPTSKPVAPVATPQKAAASTPSKTASSAVDSTTPLGLQNEEAAAPVTSTVTDSGVKRGYSSIVSALASKLPPELPSIATVLDEAPLSVFEFCMRCQDASTLGSPVASPLVTRGLVNPKSDCFQNCILQALFALPHFRRLLHSFRDCRRLDQHLPLWSEMLRFARQFLVNPVELDNPSLSEASSGGKSRRTASVASSARHKDCVLASEAMPRLCSSFDTLVHREGHRVSDEVGDGLKESVSGTLRLAEAFDQLQLSSADDVTAATAKPALSLADTLKQSTNASSISVAPTTRRTKAASAAGSNNSQQDAMEFLTFVLDALHEELNGAASALLTTDERGLLTALIQSLPAYQQTSEQLAQATMTAAGTTDEWATVRRSQPPAVKQVTVDAASKAQALRDLFAPSIIPRLCHGLLRSEVVYKTKKMCSITFQKFHCLTLNLRAPSPGSGPAHGRVTVRDALINYFAEESLDSESLRKQSRFEVLPETLILHIGRFAFDYRLNQPVKMHTAVEYAHVLAVPRECLSGALSPQDGAHSEAEGAASLPRYRLHAVVLHHGKKATGGHYSTLVRASVDDVPLSAEEDTATRWRSVDDHKITQISADQALDAAERVYLLFYVRIH